jgi:hypothetical protein
MVKAALFPHSFRKFGWILFIPGVVLGGIYMVYEFEWSFMNITLPTFRDEFQLFNNYVPEAGPRWRIENLTNELICFLILFGAMFVAFSKEIDEDEFHVHLRLSALVWAVYLNIAIQIIAIIILYGFAFLFFMQTNLFLVMILFIVRYHWILRKYKLQTDAQ